MREKLLINMALYCVLYLSKTGRLPAFDLFIWTTFSQNFRYCRYNTRNKPLPEVMGQRGREANRMEMVSIIIEMGKKRLLFYSRKYASLKGKQLFPLIQIFLPTLSSSLSCLCLPLSSTLYFAHFLEKLKNSQIILLSFSLLFLLSRSYFSKQPFRRFPKLLFPENVLTKCSP